MKPIPNLPGYFANKLGKIISRKGHKPKVLKQHWDKDGYCKVTLMRPDGTWSPYSVHRLIMIAFRGDPPEGHVCHHKDTNKTNNRLNNLKWVTQEENLAHRNIQRGTNRPAANLDEDKVREMRKLYKGGKLSVAKIAVMYGVCSATAREAIIGRHR